MKKLLLLSAFAMLSCGTENQDHVEVFAAEEIVVKKTNVCENLDASVKEEMDAAVLQELCETEPICGDFEVTMDCNGEWCITYRTCRFEQSP